MIWGRCDRRNVRRGRRQAGVDEPDSETSYRRAHRNQRVGLQGNTIVKRCRRRAIQKEVVPIDGRDDKSNRQRESAELKVSPCDTHRNVRSGLRSDCCCFESARIMSDAFSEIKQRGGGVARVRCRHCRTIYDRRALRACTRSARRFTVHGSRIILQVSRMEKQWAPYSRQRRGSRCRNERPLPVCLYSSRMYASADPSPPTPRVFDGLDRTETSSRP